MSEHKNDGIQSLNVKNMFYILVRFSKKSGKQTRDYSKGICFYHAIYSFAYLKRQLTKL